MRSNAKVSISGILLTSFLFGCAAKSLPGITEYALFSKHTAEALYQALYAGARTGQVPPDDLRTAERAYDAWAISQNRYMVAAQEGRFDAHAATEMQAQIQVLTNLAIEHGVNPWPRN